MFDEYIREEVIPFIHSSTASRRAFRSRPFGASLGAYHAANTLLRYPASVKRCYGFSGVYDLRRFMDGMYDDNFYFQNPVDYMANLGDGWYLAAAGQLRDPAGDRLRAVRGQRLHATRSRRCSARKGIRHHVDDWGPRRAATTGRTGRRRSGSMSRDGEVDVRFAES